MRDEERFGTVIDPGALGRLISTFRAARTGRDPELVDVMEEESHGYVGRTTHDAG